MTKLFRTGQAVTLNKRVRWVRIYGENGLPKPEFGKVYHCAGYSQRSINGFVYIYLSEMSSEDIFPQQYFSPLIDDHTLALELKEVFEGTIKK